MGYIMSEKSQELIQRIKEKAEREAQKNDAQDILSPEGVTLFNLNEKNNETLEALRKISQDSSMEK